MTAVPGYIVFCIFLALTAAMDSESILTKSPPPADAKLAYGTDPYQFGEMRLPGGKGRHPVLTFIHGGFWRAKYDLKHAGHLCAALAKSGIATWNLEYRRVGNFGGGWPGTFEDILQGYRFLSQLAARYSLDMNRSLIAGHSAGGQLALCLAAHQRLAVAVISLAGVVDLQQAWDLHLSHDAVAEFLGGSPQRVPKRYEEASPIQLPLGQTPQWLIHGADDDTVPPVMSRHYVEVKRKRGEQANLLQIEHAGHFDLIDPESNAWKQVQETTLQLIQRSGRRHPLSGMPAKP